MAPPSPVNLRETAQTLRVTPQTLYNWRNAGCPVDEGIVAIRAWLSTKGEAKSDASDLKERKLLAECIKIEAEAEAKELANQIARSEVANVEDMTAELAERLIHMKAMHESMIDEIAKESPQESRVRMRAIAKETSDRCLRKIANWKPGEGE